MSDGNGTINSNNPDVGQVAAALADACHAGGLSDEYYRKADDALARLAARLDRHGPGCQCHQCERDKDMRAQYAGSGMGWAR